MTYSYYKFEDRGLIKLDNKIDPKQWVGNLNWVNIYTDDKTEIIQDLSFLGLSEEIKRVVSKPEDCLLTKTFNDIVIQNFIISKESKIDTNDYLTFILTKELIICILPEDEIFNLEEEGSEHLKNQFTKDTIYYSYLLIQKILTQSTLNVRIARKQLYSLEQSMIELPNKISSTEVINVFTQIWRLSEIIEEQYIGFKFFYTTMLNKQKEPDSNKLREIIDSFSELSRITDKQEEKIEYIRMHFMLIHQEESSHKINILTIVQAIFVPLTFLAGVYGMNFTNMPELNWEYSYFAMWGIFVLMAVILLYFFKKHGWFD